MKLAYKKVRQILLVAHHQYIAWLWNGKQLVVLAILFFLMQYVSKPLINLSVKTGVPLQWAETFIAAVNSAYMIPIILFGFITLMSEYPKRNYEDVNIFFRTKRSNWYYGQVLFGVYAILTFLAEIVVLFLLRLVKIAYPDNGWSPITRHYMERYLDTGKECGVVTVVPAEVYNHFAPVEAFIYTLLLFAGMFLVINLIMLLCNLLNKRTTGIVINVLLVVLGTGMLYIKSDYLKFLPMGNVVLRCQNLPVTQLTERYEPILYFLIINIVLVILGRITIRKVQL